MKKQHNFKTFADDILNAMDGIDDDLVKDAKKTISEHKMKKKVFAGVGISVLCLVIVFCIPFLPMFIMGATSENHGVDQEGIGPETENENFGTYSEDAVIQKGEVEIYFVENGEIKSEKETLPFSPKEIFSAWQSKNLIGEEVVFIKSEIKSNGKEYFSEFEGEGVAGYENGDVFFYYLTVSKNLEDYYEKSEKDLLLKSLEKTMTGYSNIEFSDFKLILK